MPLPFSIWNKNVRQTVTNYIYLYLSQLSNITVCPLLVRANASQHQTPLHQTPMPTRRKQLVAEEPCGSGQSAASLAADKAAQSRLFAAAAARKGISKNKKSSNERLRLLDLKSLVTSSPSSAAPSSTSSSTPRKGDKAVFTLMKAKYMKGERAGTYSGAIYFQGKPTYGNNQTFKDKVHPKLISEMLRWTDDVKLYSAKIYTYKQAVMVLDAMRQVSEKDEKDLADVE